MMLKNEAHPVSQQAVLMFTDKEHPSMHPLDVLQNLLRAAKLESILCIDQGATGIELIRVFKGAADELSKHYNPSVSFFLVPIDLSLCISETYEDTVEYFSTKTDEASQTNLRKALTRLDDYKKLLNTVGMSNPYLITMVPYYDGSPIQPTVIGSFVCEYEAYNELSLLQGKNLGHTLH